MCCRTLVRPLNREVAEAQLAIGGFRQLPDGTTWERVFPEEATAVKAYVGGTELTLALSPAIHNMEGHVDKRLAAGCMYSIAVAYAEKVGGQVLQSGVNVPACMDEGLHDRRLGHYPEDPFTYERLCAGFRIAFLAEANGEAAL